MSFAPSAYQTPSRSCTLAALLCLFAACDRPGVELVQPEGTTVADNSLALRTTLAEETGVTPAELGWTAGVPGAEVTLLRVRDYQPIVRTAGASDALGVAVFDPLPGGLQWVTALRRLEGPEEEALPEVWPVAAVAWGGKVSVSGVIDTIVPLHPTMADGLVISEVHANGPPPWETNGSYYGSRYVELHNNATTPQYLDGMLLGVVYRAFKDYSSNGHHSCASTESVRTDPEGLWTSYVLRFPGGGGTHAVAPGQSVVVAVSATDHRPVHNELLDLTEADFEVRPVELALADNPASPDLEDIGPEPFAPQLFLIGNAWFLASPTDLASLPTMTDPGHAPHLPGAADALVRIPNDQIVDATHVWWDNAGAYTQSGPNPICRDPVNPRFDAVPGGFLRGTGEPLISAQRRPVMARDGRVVLLDTNVSALDFMRHTVTPGWIPEVVW